MLSRDESNSSSLLKNIFITNILILFLYILNRTKNIRYSKLKYFKDIDKKEINMILESKKLGYDILLNTISEYLDQYQDEDFEHFLEIMWPSDYIILQKSKQKIEGYSRDYQEWKDLFYMMIKNK